MCGLTETYCGTLCTVKDGKFVHVEGNPLAGNNCGHGGRTLCAKGNSAPQLVYDPSRITYPMKLVGEKGSGKFERITWDEALDTIADKLKKCKDEYGPESFCIFSGQSAEVVDTLGMRFLNLYGSPNWCHDGLCWDQRETTKACTIGKASTFPGQIDKTNLLVTWGTNKENTGVNQTRGKNYDRIRQSERGMVTIDIRPMYEPMTAHSDVWVPVRPGTDGALALAILHVIIGEDLYDHDFTANWCNGFDKLVEHVKQFTPEWASDITGVPAEQIYKVARMMGTIKPMALMDGNGFGDQTNDGTWTSVSIFLIQAITGNLDVPGGNGAGLKSPDPMFKLSDMDWFFPTLHEFDKLPASDEDLKNGWQPGTSKLIAPEFPRWAYGKFTYSLSSCNPRVLELLDSDSAVKPHVIFSHQTNSLSCLRQPKRVKELLKKCDFHFIMDTHWNPTCDFCDIVLPACTQYEASDQVHMIDLLAHTFISVNHKLVEPIGESMSDYKVYAELAKRMGFEKDWWNGETDGMLDQLLEGSGFTLEQLRAADEGIAVERPAEQRVVKEPEYRRYRTCSRRFQTTRCSAITSCSAARPTTPTRVPSATSPCMWARRKHGQQGPRGQVSAGVLRRARSSTGGAQPGNNLPWCREILPYPWCRSTRRRRRSTASQTVTG